MYRAIVIKHVAFFIIWAKLSGIHMYSLPLNLYTSVFGCGCGFGFEKKMAKRRIWRKNGTERVNRDLHTPIYPLPPPPSSLFHMYQKIFMSDLAGQFGTMPGSILREDSIKKNDLLILARFAL